MSTDFSKYQKYKQKYLNLKKSLEYQTGGMVIGSIRQNPKADRYIIEGSPPLSAGQTANLQGYLKDNVSQYITGAKYYPPSDLSKSGQLNIYVVPGKMTDALKANIVSAISSFDENLPYVPARA